MKTGGEHYWEPNICVRVKRIVEGSSTEKLVRGRFLTAGKIRQRREFVVDKQFDW